MKKDTSKLTLQKLVDQLQVFAHHGHAQDKVVIGNKETSPESVEVRAFGSGQVIIDFGKEDV